MNITTIAFLVIVGLALIMIAYGKIATVRNKKLVGSLLAERGMKQPQEFVISDVYRLLVDKSVRRWCVYKMGDKTPRVLKYDELEDFEICDHGVLLADGDGSGPLYMAGFLESIRGTKSVSNVCSRLILTVKLTDGQAFSFPFISQATVRSSQKYSIALNYAKQVAEQLKAILGRNQKAREKSN